MNRRTVLKNLALVIGGAVLLPSCVGKDGSSYVQLKHVSIDEDGQRLIADMAETIIPKTDTPGATDLNLYGFAMKMVDECTKKQDQETFLKGMAEFDAVPKKIFNKPFVDCNKQEKQSVLKSFEQKTIPIQKSYWHFTEQ